MHASQRLRQSDAVRRLWERDVTLFGHQVLVREVAANRLGWLGLASQDDPIGATTRLLAAEVQAENVADVVLLGMGGSSLAPLVLSRILAEGPGHPRLHVLDTTCPVTVAGKLASLEPERTLVVVASKSGGTIEPNSLYAVFRARFDALLLVEAGARFIAITDPGTTLEALALEAGFRAVVPAPADVGGRYSALTSFGLVPAALLGIDTGTLLDSAEAMEAACREREIGDNPGASLAAFAADAHAAGRDKLTLATSSELAPFGLWVEQLIAESTGKEGTGLVPVLETSPSIPTGFGPDRAVVVMRYEEDDALADWADVARDEGAPVHEIVVGLPSDIGGEFVRWEVATALVGVLLGIDPFDEPNVAEAKAATNAILDLSLPEPEAAFTCEGIGVTYGVTLEAPAVPAALAEALAPFFDAIRPGDYLAALVYLPEREELFGPLRAALKRVSVATRTAVCVELGPRYLHSTGQLHKGGPNEGVFLIVTYAGGPDLDVPGRPFTLGRLYRAQAAGDLATLDRHGRRVVRVELPSADPSAVTALADTLAAIAEG